MEGITFSGPGRKFLSINFTVGEIYYSDEPAYFLNNPAKDVPTTNQLFQLATYFLPKLTIDLSELAKEKNGRPAIRHVNDMGSIDTSVTNIVARDVHFSRALDGVKFFHFDGYGEIDFGEHGNVVKMDIEWPDYKREKTYSTATPKKIIQWIREGRAMQKRMIQSEDNPAFVIDWSTARSLTITNATAYYYAEFFDFQRVERPIFPSHALPFAELWAQLIPEKPIFRWICIVRLLTRMSRLKSIIEFFAHRFKFAHEKILVASRMSLIRARLVLCLAQAICDVHG